MGCGCLNKKKVEIISNINEIKNNNNENNNHNNSNNIKYNFFFNIIKNV